MLDSIDIKWLHTPKEIPLVQLSNSLTEDRGVELWVARLDFIDPLISGNKWFKLKYNLLQSYELGHSHIVSFGGAYSNHLHALASACRRLGVRSTGIVRGELVEPLNPTLQDCVDNDMTLIPVTRSQYRQKNSQSFIDQLRRRLGHCYIVPEGGSNTLALKGMSEVSEAIMSKLEDIDYLCCPVGSGGTLAGLSLGLAASKARCIGFSALKGADYMESEINALHQQYADELSGSLSGYELEGGSERCIRNWNLVHDYHFGGFAKIDAELQDFIEQFEVLFGVPLEPVYTAKMFYGLFDLIGRSQFERGARIVAVHTGGLQGRRGYVSMFGQ